MASNGNEKLSLSREMLRAELTQLELRLVDRLSSSLETKADSKVVEQHDARIKQLELNWVTMGSVIPDLTDIDHRVILLERFRHTIPSVSFLSLAATVVMAIVYVLHY